jgi:hypothetical protein
VQPQSIFTPTITAPVRTFEVNKTNQVSGLTVEKSGAKTTTLQPQTQLTKLTKEEAQDLTVEYLSEDIQAAIDVYRRQDNGIVVKGYDSLKNFFNTELSSKNVGEVPDKEITGLEYLQKAKDGQLTKKETSRAKS